MAKQEISHESTKALMAMLWQDSVKHDLYRFVMAAYPWGKPNTPLANVPGPRKWQKEELDRITLHLNKNIRLVAEGKTPEVYRLAISSGRGPGKSALVSWLAHWMMSVNLGATTIVSANTDSQLTGKTFAEIKKWFTLAINGYWFEATSKKITPQPWYAEAIAKARQIDSTYYYAEGVLWNEDNPDAFAGAHNPNGMLLLFDEASGIPQSVWSVSAGFFTDVSIYRFWVAFSNPRSNTGAFFECFHRNREYWNTRKIDSRAVEGLDRAVYDQIIAQYGEDSDEARIEVKGDFPSQGDRQFISRGLVADAQSRELERLDDHAALVMGVDPARYGDDSTVIRFRRGRDGRSYPAVKMKGADNMRVANEVARLIDLHNPDAVFVDAGSGTGVIDRLREMGFKVFEVWFGSASSSPEYFDHRTELWARMRDWLGGAMVDGDDQLRDDLCGPEYGFQGREDRIKLESKESMKKRGLSSPDHADALAVTFHAKVGRPNLKAARNAAGRKARIAEGTDFNPFR